MSQIASVLVVEDNTPLRQVFIMMLASLGIKADAASDGVEAFECVMKGNYGLVLMDIEMPIMNGLQATSAIRELESKQSRVPISIVAVTGGGASQHQCMEAGITAFYEKPIGLEELEKIVREFAPHLLANPNV